MKTSIVAIGVLFISLSSAYAQGRVADAFIQRENVQRPEAVPSLFQERQVIPHKSVLLAVTLSLLVPGTGELYAGNFESGKYSLLAEGAVWVTYAAFTTHGNWVRRDAHVFATERAGANFASKTDKYDVDIGNYISIDEYNQAKLRNRDFDLLYTDPSYYWKWDTDADRASFKQERIRSDQIYQNSKFIVAAAIVNRVWSAFSAGRATSIFNRRALVEGAWNLEVHPTSTVRYADGINLALTIAF